MSALATIVGSLGELSESELRQLYLMVGVRLGIPDVPTGVKPQGKGGGKASNAKTSSAKGGKKSASSKGNPQRKSQWANHPLYQEYSRLKKVVETQAKEAGTSFNAVDTAESRAYRQAFSQWLGAKSSFRGHGESGQDRVKPGEKKQDEEGSSEEEEEEEENEAGKPSSSQPPVSPLAPKQQAKPVAPLPAPVLAGKSSGSSGKTRGSPTGKGKGAVK